jgi:FkbM family methyltransferase
MKDIALKLCLSFCRFCIQKIPLVAARFVLWRHVVLPHMKWRPIKTRARTAFGSLMNIDLRDAIQSYIYFFGLFEPTITYYVKQTLSRGDIFIDIGANVGYYTLLAAKLVGPSGKVFSIEASPAIFRMLLNNLELNSTTNVTAVNVAITDVPREVTVYLHDETNLGGSTIMSAVAAKRATAVEGVVPGLPLPSVLDPDVIRKARLIKIDVEGAEWGVLLGLRKLIPALSPYTEIILEVDPRALNAQGVKIGELLDLFESANFEALIVENKYSDDFYLARVYDEPRPLTNSSCGQTEPFLCDLTDLILRRRGPDLPAKTRPARTAV